MRSYLAFIHKAPDSDYTVTFPDFPTCITAGDTLMPCITPPPATWIAARPATSGQ